MNADDWKLVAIPGARDLFEWFGHWPSFHDAEVVEVYLCRTRESRVVIHTCRVTKAGDHYEFDKDVLVTFKIHDIQELELEGFNMQNVLSSLEIKRSDALLELELFGLYGLSGLITAKAVSIELAPGRPCDGV